MSTWNKGCITFSTIANLTHFSNCSALDSTCRSVLTATAIRLHERILRRICITIHSNDVVGVDRGRLCVHVLWPSSVFLLSSFKVLGLTSTIWDGILLPPTGSLHNDTIHGLVLVLLISSHSNWCSRLTLTKIRVLITKVRVLTRHLILHRPWELITSISSLNEVWIDHLLILHLTLHLVLLNYLSWDLLLCIGCTPVVRTLCIWRWLVWPVLAYLGVCSIRRSTKLLLWWTLIVVISIVLILLILSWSVLHCRSGNVVLLFFFLELELSDEAVSSLSSGSSLVHILISYFPVDDWHVSQRSNIVILHYKDSATNFNDIIDFKRMQSADFTLRT